MYKDKHGTVSKQHPSLIIIIVTVSTLQKPVFAKTCEDYVGCQWLLGRWYPWLEFWCWQRHHQCRHPHHQQHHQQTRTWGGGKYSWAKEGNYRMLHVICSMYLIWYMHLTSLNYALWHWANSKSDLPNLSTISKSCYTFERQLCQMSLGQLNFDCPQFLVGLRRRTNLEDLSPSVPWPMMPIHKVNSTSLKQSRKSTVPLS